ncbi:cytokinesis protein 3, partial [Nowakowskiella sp. JEL0407]
MGDNIFSSLLKVFNPTPTQTSNSSVANPDNAQSVNKHFKYDVNPFSPPLSKEITDLLNFPRIFIQVFFSYCWADKDIVRSIADALEKRGIRIWIDVKNMTLKLNAAMAAGINDSALIVLFISDDYVKSHNCALEYNYANDQKKSLIAVRLSQSDEVKKAVPAFLTSGQLYVELTDPAKKSEKIDELEAQIRQIVPGLKSAPPPNSTPPPNSASQTYDVYISYRVDTDDKTAQVLFQTLSNLDVSVYFRKTQSPNDATHLEVLKKCEKFVLVISEGLLRTLPQNANESDAVLLELDTVLDQIKNGSKQKIIPVFIRDGHSTMDLESVAAAMKDVAVASCARTPKVIWDEIASFDGLQVDPQNPHQTLYFARKILGLARSINHKVPESQASGYYIRSENIFRSIKANLGQQSSNVRVCNLYGFGGSGKSYTANMYVNNAYSASDCLSVAQLAADSAANLLKAYKKYIQLLYREEVGVDLVVDYREEFGVDLVVDEMDLDQLVKVANERIFSKQLIHLDNVKNYNDIRDLIQLTKNLDVMFLITSRKIVTSPNVKQEIYELNDCIEYLRNVTGRDSTTDKEWEELFEEVHRMPLRLSIAATYLKNNKVIDIQSYIKGVNKIKLSDPTKYRTSEKPTDDYDDYYAEVSLSLDTIKQSDTFWFLILLVKLDPDFIVLRILEESFVKFRESWDAEKYKDVDLQNFEFAQNKAIEYGLIEFATAAKDVIRIHRCIQAEIRSRVNHQNMWESLAISIKDAYQRKLQTVENLVRALNTGNVRMGSLILQNWTECKLDVSDITEAGLKVLAESISSSGTVKELELRYLM